ncbi:hypothetical protein [Moorena producens]|nr:hypothetical protein [Moorena producens]
MWDIEKKIYYTVSAVSRASSKMLPLREQDARTTCIFHPGIDPMLTKILTATTVAIALFTIVAGYTQRSALVLREEKQENYWPRHRTYLSGYYYLGIWESSPNRSDYGSFRGGGPATGK